MSEIGTLLAFLGPAFAEAMAAIGSTIGTYKAASTGLAVISEDPRMFGRVIPLAALPATQTIAYGFLFMFMAYSRLRALAEISIGQGAGLLALSIFVGAAELWSAYMQGKVCGDGAALLVKTSGRIMSPTFILAIFEEVFGLLAMVFGILMMGIILG